MVIRISFFLLIILLEGCIPSSHIANLPQTLRQDSALTLALPYQSEAWWTVFSNVQLNQYIQHAFVHSPTLAIADQRVQRAAATAALASSQEWPTLGLEAKFPTEKFSQNYIYPAPFTSTFHQGFVFLNAEYEVDFFGKNRSLALARLNDVDAERLHADASRLSLSVTIAELYFEIQGIQAELNIVAQMEKDTQSLLQLARQLVKHRLLPVTSVYSASLQWRSIQLERSSLEQLRQQKHSAFLQLIGENATASAISLSKLSAFPVGIPLKSYLPLNILASRPDVQAYRTLIQSAYHDERSAQARFYPNINVSAFFSYQSLFLNNLFTAGSRDYGYGPALDLPIFDANARLSNFKIKRADYNIAVLQYNQTVLLAFQQAAAAIAHEQEITRRLRTQQHKVNTVYATYLVTQKRLAAGIDSRFNVLNQRLAWLQEKRTLARLQIERISALIHVAHVFGGKTVIFKLRKPHE